MELKYMLSSEIRQRNTVLIVPYGIEIESC